MSNTKIYTFHETGAIPGIPNPDSIDGQFHAGQKVTVDLDTMSIVGTELFAVPSDLGLFVAVSEHDPSRELVTILPGTSIIPLDVPKVIEPTQVTTEAPEEAHEE